MRNNKSLPLIVASLLLAMSLSACNFELSLNGDGGSSSSSQTSSSSSGSSSSEDIPDPSNEVTADIFLSAAYDAEKTNPGYQSADVTMFYYDGTEHNITAKFYKDADETEDWELVDEESVTDYAYELAEDLIEVHATFVQSISQTMSENKYYLDNSGFKYVGTARGEYQGTSYYQEMTLTFNQYGYCVYAKQTGGSGSSIQDTVRFTAKYSTEPVEGHGVPSITEEVTLEQFLKAAQEAEKRDSGYKSAKTHFVLTNPQLDNDINLKSTYVRNATTGEWTYYSGDSDQTYSITISTYLSLKISKLTLTPENVEAYDCHFYMNDKGFRFTGIENTETGLDKEEIYFDTYGFLTHLTSEVSERNLYASLDVVYSTSAPEGPSPTTDLSDSDWNTFVNNTLNINRGYKTATLDCTYHQSGGQGASGANFDIVYTSTTGARGSWVRYSTTNETLADAFEGLVNTSPASFVNREGSQYKITYKYGNNTYFAYMSYGNFSTEVRFNEDGYIIYGKNIEEDDDTRLEYYADVTYSLNEITPLTPDDPGEDKPSVDYTITDKEWAEYATNCQKEALAYDTVNATVAKYLTNSKNIYDATLTNSTGDPSDWTVASSDGDDSLASYATGGLVVRPIDCLVADEQTFDGTIKYTSDGSYFRCDSETNGVKEVFAFDTKGNPIYLAHEVDGTLISVSYNYSNSSSGQEESNYDTTIRERVDGQYMFAVGGDPTLGWEPSDELLMSPTSIDEVSKVSEDVADVLQAKERNIDYLYMKTITLGTSTANWTAPIIINDYKYSIDGALTFKAVSATYDEEEQIYQTQTWCPSDMSFVENLTPETYFMPDWEEECDYYQMNCYSDNPVSYEPGEYVLVVAGYDSFASKNNYSEAMALIRIDDVVSSIGEPKLEMGYDVVVIRNDASIDYHSLHINPENRQEFMVTNIYVEEGELIKFLNVPEDDDFFIANLDTHSQGFDVYLGKIRCTQSGYYDFYVTFSLDGHKVYIGQSQKA